MVLFLHAIYTKNKEKNSQKKNIIKDKKQFNFINRDPTNRSPMWEILDLFTPSYYGTNLLFNFYFSLHFLIFTKMAQFYKYF